ncbi:MULTISPECIES: hypothetical protein [Bacillales]|uniref:DUF4352 domain-containing protein n=1 Tax=Lysinibacillus louembei TaxID=1470088 RepID=A0ABZ0RWU0_9BACI|nr:MULTISPECIES: hypothetical protein [Bacillales]MCT6925225.1 hypothetical protein [Metasolibacillus sp.]MCT6941417.1 hypothetical protein [Metasolibacillus sp.]WPK12703.1 hypothetical protein R6U77_03095 [Lysinibacillus louembei]
MKTLQSFITLVIITLLLLLGGCVQESNEPDNPQDQITDKVTIPLQKRYYSVLDYNNFITGEHLVCGIPDISYEGNYLNIKLKIRISSLLQEKMLNTESPFYFNIADIPGHNTLLDVTAEPPIFVEGDLDKLKDGNYYIITQSIKLIEDVPAEIIEKLLLPDTYVLEVVNEETLVVAIFAGLEVDMLDKPM